jgi:hypothetical protein
MEELADTKGVFRIRKSEDRQHNDQKKNDKRTISDLQNIAQKNYRSSNTNPTKNWGGGRELRGSGRVRNSCSTSGTFVLL